jgi:hypothetical protein
MTFGNLKIEKLKLDVIPDFKRFGNERMNIKRNHKKKI